MHVCLPVLTTIHRQVLPGHHARKQLEEVPCLMGDSETERERERQTEREPKKYMSKNIQNKRQQGDSINRKDTSETDASRGSC